MRGSYWGMAIYVFWEYLAGAAYHNYAPLFFSQKGFAPGQISLLIGIGPLVAIVLQPLWGMLSDRSAYKNTVHRILLLGAACAVPLLLPAQGLLAALGAVALLSCFSTSATPMGETIVLEHLESQGKNFGPLRVWGTASFAVGAQLMGVLVGDAPARFVWLCAGWFLCAAAASLLLPRVAGHQHAKRKTSWKPLLNRKTLLTLLALVAAMQLTQGLYFSFFALHFTGDLGGSKVLFGAAGLIAAASEIPFLLLGDRLLARFGVRKLVVCAAAMMALRWALLGMLRDPNWVLVSQVLGGFGLIVPTFCVVKHIQQTVPAALKASGQMLAAVITFGIGRGLVGPLGWGLSRLFGSIAPIFWAMAGICAAAALGIGLPLLRAPEEPCSAQQKAGR